MYHQQWGLAADVARYSAFETRRRRALLDETTVETFFWSHAHASGRTKIVIFGVRKGTLANKRR